MIEITLNELVESYGDLQAYALDNDIPEPTHWKLQEKWEVAIKYREQVDTAIQRRAKSYGLVQVGIDNQGRATSAILKPGYKSIPTSNPHIFKIQKDGEDVKGDPSVAYDSAKLDAYNKELENLLKIKVKLPGEPFKTEDFLPRNESLPRLPWSAEVGRRLKWFRVRGADDPAPEEVAMIDIDPQPEDALDAEIVSEASANGTGKPKKEKAEVA